MKHNNFFANAASKALALAATVMMMSAAFTACSSSNDDPTTEPKANTVTIDGVDKPILKAKYIDQGDGDDFLYLYLSADSREKVEIQLNKDLHMTGSPIDLTKKEEKHDGKWYWGVKYSDHGKSLFDTWGAFGSPNTLFNTGTLTVSGSPDGTINIVLKNGCVKGLDGKEQHTIVLSYSGTMENIGGSQPQPQTNTVTVNGTDRKIEKVEYYEYPGERYYFTLYLTPDGKENVLIGLKKDRHFGKDIDLTKREPEDDDDFWVVRYDTNESGKSFTYYGQNPDDHFFKSGTLNGKATFNSDLSGTLNLVLKNGKIKNNDGTESTFLINYNGPIESKQFVDLGLSSGTKWAKCNVGADKPEAYGKYFAWGETEDKSGQKSYDWGSYKWANKSNIRITKYCTNPDHGSNGFTDGRTELEAADDAATRYDHVSCTPTQAQMEELMDKCTWTWKAYNGVYGYEVKGPNYNRIFLPAAGLYYNRELNKKGTGCYYWTKTLDTNASMLAVQLKGWRVDDSDEIRVGSDNRCRGLSVRGVRKK